MIWARSRSIGIVQMYFSLVVIIFVDNRVVVIVGVELLDPGIFPSCTCI